METFVLAVLMKIFVSAVLIGLVPAVIAQGKGRSFVLWWIYGTALFIVALPHSLMMNRDDKTIEKRQINEGMKKCPFCAEMIKSEAIKCKHCGADIKPPSASPNEPPASDTQQIEEYGITFDGERYVYGEYKYGKLSDAISYAKLQKNRSV